MFNLKDLKTSSSHYLSNDNRLGDVISAIQVMGSYSFYKLSYQKWAIKISGDEKNSEYWKSIFSDHPEFFRLDTTGDKASLVWRRSHRRVYSVDDRRELTKDEFDTFEDKSRLSRAPLTGDDISVLINTAINLHARAIEQNKENRYLSSPLFSLLGVVLGAAMALLLKS